jgi:YD repeat-containing protein
VKSFASIFIGFLCVSADAALGPWFPTPGALECTNWFSGSTGYVQVVVISGNQCYGVSDWGDARIYGDQIVLDAKLDQTSRLCTQVVSRYTHTYELGVIKEGTYAVLFESHGTVATNFPISVPPCDTDRDGLPDWWEVLYQGAKTNRFYYDKIDRLVGAEYSSGLVIGYQYDGNGNLLRQSYMSQADSTNGLPVLWMFLAGLTNGAPGSGAFDDPDGDGWSNLQEWKAGSNPLDTNSLPDLLGLSGIKIGTLALPFTPSNFVVGVGQLDGLGAEEIVLGADGNPGTNTNFLLVLTQTTAGWQTQRVDMGPFGVTSLAVGQVANRPGPAIYASLRQSGGTGRVVELLPSAGAWQTNVVATSTNEAAFVLGVRGQDLLASLATTNAADGALYSVGFSGSWSVWLFDSTPSHRGLGTLVKSEASGGLLPPLRLLDTNGIACGLTADNNPDPENLTWIPPGTFTMGSPVTEKDRDASEGPQTQVTISKGFWMSKYEVTQGNYQAVMGSNPSYFTGDLQRPVEMVTWLEATNYCGVLTARERAAGRLPAGSYRLPTEAEWEYSCRAGATTRFYYGDDPNYTDLGLYAWYSGGQTHPVGLKRPNQWDLYDMSGNVWEWCSDWHGAYPGGSVNDPTGSLSGSYRVFRGGGWNYGSSYCRSSFRGYVLPDGRHSDIGFRPVLADAGPALADAGLVRAVLIPEPPVIRRNNWRGISLASGSLRGTNSSSIFYTFADDKNANGLIDFGDDFVTAEYLMSSTNASLLTLSHQPIASPWVAQSYGLASVNFLSQSNEVFFTGEPDGQVFVWTATGATNPLQRQLFSAHHVGKAWHALAGVKTLQPGEGLVGLRVDPAAPNTCDVIFWSPASVPQTAPLARILPEPNQGGGVAKVKFRLWDSEGNASLPLLQFQPTGATNWLDGTISSVDRTNYNLSMRVSALPTGSDHELLWNAAHDLGQGVRTNVSLRIRARDITLLGDWSEPVPYEIAIGIDSDGDGLPDDWEIANFGNLEQTADGDPDHDGFTNLQEYIAGTDPNDRNSNLRLAIRSEPGGMRLEWQGGTNAIQFLQRSRDFDGTNIEWFDIFTNPAPTPWSNSYFDTTGTNRMDWYRIRVER